MKINAILKFSAICLFLFNIQTVSSDTINVAVASNFKHTLQALKPLFEANSIHQINIISASTGQLLQQASQGAPFDIFLAANTAHPQKLWQHLHQVRNLQLDALKTYALGRLVFYSNLPLDINTPLADILQSSQFQRLSIANSKLAPYGLAGEQTLKCLNVYEKWKPHLIIGQNVAQVIQFIDTQNVNAGLVAMSQVLEKDLNHIRIIDNQCYTPIKQSALRLNNKKASLEFMDFLDQSKTKVIILQHGYLLP